LLHKRIPGGHITLAGANSPASLRSRPIRFLLCDEVSGWEKSAGKEGDPLSLATKRTQTFRNRKIIKISSPGVEGLCRITADFDETDKCYYYVPCPFCGTFQTLQWHAIKWDKTPEVKHIPETVYYFCASCGKHIHEKYKQEMLEAGEWRPTCKPRNPRSKGFHINGLYSPWLSWENIVREHLETDRTKDVARRQVFINSVLAETWTVRGSTRESTDLMQRREPYTTELLPEGVLMLAVGVDVQDNMFQWEIVGYGYGLESWGIQWGQIIGDLNHPHTWGQLLPIFERKFKHSLGGEMGIVTGAIDSGGSHTQTVYNFCNDIEYKRIYAVKGRGGQSVPVLSKPKRVEPSQALLFSLGVDSLKEDFYFRLGVKDPGPGYCHFPIHYGADIIEQFTSEEQRTEFRNGFPYHKWVMKSKTLRNEGLDIRNYIHAMVMLLNPDWEAVKENLKKQGKVAESKKPKPSWKNDIEHDW